MRRCGLLVLVVALLVPAGEAKTPVTDLLTVAQFEQMLRAARGASDGTLARQIANVRLTERLSSARLAKLEAALPGRESREQALAVADESMFREFPNADRVTDAAPDRAVQGVMLARAVAYVKETVARWPSFSAWRATTRFEGTATVLAFGLRDDLSTRTGAVWLRSPAAENWNCPGQLTFRAHRLDVIERATVPVLYRQGHVVRVMGAGGEFECAQTGVSTSGEFSEVSVLVPLIANLERAHWSHWEQGIGGPAAVFSYSAEVDYGASAVEAGQRIEIEGELAIQPADGAILRLTEVRRWMVESFSREYDTAIEFGSETVGGVTLLLPERRVAMFLTPILKPRTWEKMESTYRKYGLTDSPLQEYVNDARYGSYRPYAAPAGQSAEPAGAGAP